MNIKLNVLTLSVCAMCSLGAYAQPSSAASSSAASSTPAPQVKANQALRAAPVLPNPATSTTRSPAYEAALKICRDANPPNIKGLKSLNGKPGPEDKTAPFAFEGCMSGKGFPISENGNNSNSSARGPRIGNMPTPQKPQQ